MGVAELGSGTERPGDPTIALSARGLCHRYGDFVALAPLDLEIGAGEMVSLVGPNGAGKSTLMTMAAGLLEPSEGSVTVAGAEAGTVAARAATSFLPDTPVFYEDLSLAEHLQFLAGLHGVAEHEPRATELLSRLGLGDRGDGLPREFSHGMRQKASIALAFVRPFSLLLADEPFDGLDAPSRVELMKLFREARDGGAAVLVTTHRTDVLAQSDRCIALFDGALAYDGPPDPTALGEFFDD
jgi:ABC-type multidrug transport system ATPase subunit